MQLHILALHQVMHSPTRPIKTVRFALALAYISHQMSFKCVNKSRTVCAHATEIWRKFMDYVLDRQLEMVLTCTLAFHYLQPDTLSFTRSLIHSVLINTWEHFESHSARIPFCCYCCCCCCCWDVVFPCTNCLLFKWFVVDVGEWGKAARIYICMPFSEINVFMGAYV